MNTITGLFQCPTTDAEVHVTFYVLKSYDGTWAEVKRIQTECPCGTCDDENYWNGDSYWAEAIEQQGANL